MIELTGQIERITYTNEENGYTVARVSIEGRREAATVVGILHDPSPGTVLKMRGEWTVHPKFGSQFKLEEYETVVPRTTAAIERYLAAGAVKGIGPATAKQIVHRFGPQSLKVMDEEIGRLREISGIGRKRMEQIRRSWGEQKEMREVMLFLQGNGVSPAYAARIYRRYGAGSVAIVRKNPYRLASDIPGIGFVTADRIAATLGYPADGVQRLEAGLLYCLDRCVEEGHLYLTAGELLRRAAELLKREADHLRELLVRLAARRRVVAEGGLDDSTPVYPPRLFDCEVVVARRLRALAASVTAAAAEAPPARGVGRSGGVAAAVPPPAAARPGRPSFDEVPPETESSVAAPFTGPAAAPPSGGLRARPVHLGGLSMTLGADQRKAVDAALANGVTVITGGPGTGKTTIIDVLARGFAGAGWRVLLAAPTGRAAKRMAETTGREAKTIHRLLEVDPRGGGFRRNVENPLDCDALILDETSMVDIPLMAALLDAVPLGVRLILVGDADQLPSVGPGNLLADVIASAALPVVRLTEIYRQRSNSRIITGAHDVIHGRFPDFTTGEGGDFYLIEQDDPERVVTLIVTLVRERIPKRFGFDPVDEIQVLTPMNRGPAGTVSLNATLQEALNPGGPGVTRGTRLFRPGDKVMQVRNNYDLDVFNGDIGRVKRVDEEAAELVAEFDGTEVRYTSEDLDELSLAYAVTVHKAQGSEFPAVVIPLLTQHYLLLQRNLLYTAVTRGKRLVVIVGSRKALALAVGNDRTQKRNTRLSERLSSPDWDFAEN